MTLYLEPVACTLSADDYKNRVGWIKALAEQSLRAAHRSDLTLILVYGPEALDAVHELVRKEQSCCGFLHFDIRQDADGVHLTVTVPERARDAADLLFAHFVPSLTAGPRSMALSTQ